MKLIIRFRAGLVLDYIYLKAYTGLLLRVEILDLAGTFQYNCRQLLLQHDPRSDTLPLQPLSTYPFCGMRHTCTIARFSFNICHKILLSLPTNHTPLSLSIPEKMVDFL